MAACMWINGKHAAVPEDSEEGALDSMMDAENDSLRERLSHLEKKVLVQGDELMCLRATLADVLRRISQLESRGDSPVQFQHRIPVRNGSATPRAPVTNNHVVSNQQPKDSPRLRQYGYQDSGKESVRRTASYVPTSLPQRKVHYQSTGSLHSDSPSSSSVSPAPSPTPRGQTGTPQVVTPQQHSKSPLSPSSSASGSLHLSKRWSSTGDFNHVGITSQSPTSPTSITANRLATKSLFNLYLKPQQQIPQLKHGTRDATYNEEEGTVRMFMRGRPINLYAPTAVMDTYDLTKVATAPQTKLKLEWVYGYRGKDCRSNLFLLPTGEMVYFVAAAVVLYNVEEQTQRHYLGHTDDVKCLCVHPNKLLVATGQTAGHDRREGRSWKFNPPPDRLAAEAEMWPHVRIWNSVSLNTVNVIGVGDFERSICCISFSKADGGQLLCAVDEAPDHNISVWDWQRGERGHKITETKCSADTVVAAEFHPLDRQSIVTCGKSHINFWTLDAGGTLFKRMGIFENRDKPKYVTCLAFTQNGDVVSGDSNGNIIVWGRGTNTIAKFIRGVHEGSIFSICTLKEGSIISGGGKDGRLVQFDSNFSRTGVEALISHHFGSVRTIAEGRGHQLLIGTTSNCILVGALDLDFSPAVFGHTQELWGLAVHPGLPQFVTGGHDRLLQLWDSMSRSLVWSKELGDPIQSAAFSADGSIIIVGCVNGRWFVLGTETREVFSSHTDGGEPIQVIQFSPDGNFVALGSRDNNIYIYQSNDDGHKFSRVGRCTGHSSYITHLDWSTDSQFIQSNSGDYELLYWNAGLCRQVTQSSQMRDVEWATNTCTLTFNTIGIWPEGADGTDVNSCDKSHDGQLMATADDFGKVKLYNFPVTQPKSLCHVYSGHSSHVTCVSFLHDDGRLISTGGRDTSVMQWMLT